MITLTINDLKLEQAYYENFGGDDAKFIEFLSANFHANNVEYNLDPAMIEEAYDEGDASGDSGLTHDEVFDKLKKKYDIN